jgi:hypothetical protein
MGVAMIPILYDHNPDHKIGMMDKDGVVTICVGCTLTKELIEDCFGWIGYEIIESKQYGSTTFVEKFRILEYSITSSGAYQK